jgi:hypothetical protein
MKKIPTKKGGLFMERELYQSDAFLDLHKNAMTLLIALMDARKRESPSRAKDKKGSKRAPIFLNLNCLEMPYTTLQKVYGMNNQGITRAIDKLLSNGFVEITHYGGMGEHDKTKYGLINDYLEWKPGTVFRKRERDVKMGYQGKRLGATKPGAEKKLAHEIIPLHTHQNVTLPENSRTRNHTLPKVPFSPVSIGD